MRLKIKCKIFNLLTSISSVQCVNKSNYFFYRQIGISGGEDEHQAEEMDDEYTRTVKCALRHFFVTTTHLFLCLI